MFIPVSGRIDPIKPNRGFLTARPVVRSDDPDKSESADNTPRGQEEQLPDALHPEDDNPVWDTPGPQTPVSADDLLHENAVLAEHLLMQRAWPADRITAGEAKAAFHGYEEARSLTA
ncbi:hypothetical protein [Leisingera sp. ANG-M7]|uniref:hypothetical protein n=1 Tax=Leisingera sp. ANG-M7 TaxID=1577902 RepID=UPI00057E048E|nr:hypothetical protein [Leisingera sp. ANG-M7]KIC36697.1 hypothetical protein RA26_10180 [Leisingera sp. ANG-M7]